LDDPCQTGGLAHQDTVSNMFRDSDRQIVGGIPHTFSISTVGAVASNIGHAPLSVVVWTMSEPSSISDHLSCNTCIYYTWAVLLCCTALHTNCIFRMPHALMQNHTSMQCCIASLACVAPTHVHHHGPARGHRIYDASTSKLWRLPRVMRVRNAVCTPLQRPCADATVAAPLAL
jgi:hypothetical protein